MEGSSSDLNRLFHACREPVVLNKKVLHACIVPPETVTRALRSQKSSLTPERHMSTSPLLMFFLLELPLSTLFIALKPKDCEVIRNFSLFVTK